jgi:GalNAc-alpha-(1->4)-GalNAc-alpha-(1->3)-diNAcBac-PP-undecaprenol alpha-1,4-N-acetyl-D-galactosaminyltransferase
MTTPLAALREAPAPTTPRRVVLVIANLGWGGAQKVMVTMANHWVEQGWDVTLISVDAELVPSYFPIHPAVTVLHLGIFAQSPTPFHAVAHNLKRLAVLRRAIRDCRADAVISFLSTTNVLTLLATRALGVPVVVSERGDPARGNLPRAWRMLRTLLYPTAYRLVAQTETALACFPAFIRRRGLVLPNPVALRRQLDAASRRTVVAVGHLVPLKGFDLLVEGFARCAVAHPDWRLVIWGEGPERERLLALAERHGIARRVELPGRSATPGAWLETAGIFVLASRHEGFPNVLVEAMAAGLPVIATDCPAGGPRAMISDGVDGLLVANEDVAALARSLERLMADPHARHRLGDAAARSAERFSLPQIMARWTALVEEAAGPAG